MRTARTTTTQRATEFADQTPAEDENVLVIPEELAELADSELEELRTSALAAFDAVYGEGSEVSPEDVETLTSLTEGIERLQAEIGTRSEAAAERAEAAAALARQIRPEAVEETVEDEDDETEDEGEETEEEEPADGEAEAEAVAEVAESLAASGHRRNGAIRVNLSRANSRSLPQRSANPRGASDILRVAGTGHQGFVDGAGLSVRDAAVMLDRRLAGFSQTSYDAAARAGKHLRQEFSLATIAEPLDDSLRITSSDPEHVETVMRHAVDERRLRGGTLVASGGWCPPSETRYDLLELESRDGLFSLPTVGLVRGGIRQTLGPDFSDLFTTFTGFHYTEEHDIAGTYGVGDDGVGDGTAGEKPCHRIECPEFEEYRLELDGICITAGLLQQRGYPELIARTLRGVLVAHDHRMAGRKLASIEAGSTAVTMPAVGATTYGLLEAIEMQIEHSYTKYRVSRSITMEAVFPYWVRGAIRSDLARSTGQNRFDVTDAQIAAWFAARGASPQFVYNWNDLPTATPITEWPDTVKFLLYPAGTWVEGTSDVISLDTVYDSQLLGQNDYIALFTEQGSVVIPRGYDSKVVTVPICTTGAASGGVGFDCDGTVTVPVLDEGTD